MSFEQGISPIGAGSLQKLHCETFYALASQALSSAFISRTRTKGGGGDPGVLSKIVDLGGPKQRQHSSLWVPIIKMES